MAVKAGAVIGGRYQLSSEIMRTESTAAWEAIDTILDRRVAVKILEGHDLSDSFTRSEFLKMAHVGADLGHPNIVAVYDTGEHEGIPFLVMEYMEGGSLDQMIAGGALEPARVADIGEAACAALQYAHGRGVAHGRLDPGRVLLTAAGKPKLTDFSIRGAGDHERHEDLAALGRLLYLCLTRRTPEMTHGARIVRPSDYRAGIPRTLDALVMEALRNRFKDAGSMLTALAPMTGGKVVSVPASASPAPPNEIAPSFVKSEGRWLVRLALLIAAVAGIALLAINLAGRDIGDLFSEETPLPPADLQVSIYDPVDGEENDRLANNVIDENSFTYWNTDWYRTPPLGGAKPGVGLVIDLGSPKEPDHLRVQSVAGGWEGSVRTSPDGSNWSDPGPSIAVEPTHDFEIKGKHRWVMLWITLLVKTPGEGSEEFPYSVGISEISFVPN